MWQPTGASERSLSMFRAVSFFSCLVFLIACSAPVASPAYDLSKQFEVERAKLARLQAEREAAELAAAAAEQRTKFVECQTRRRDLQVAVENRLIDCKVEHARAAECNAENGQAAAGGMALGCGLGLLFPPFALVGCLGGAALGGAAGDECVKPSCQNDPDIVLREVLAEHHLQALPECTEPPGSTVTAAVTYP
jgi:hypothetical protein